jgi:CDP-glycerol glycerophosphotransferase (TagB/SpsB family)
MNLDTETEVVVVAATTSNEPTIIINKGTGAGGANTNLYGKRFEDKTNNQSRLLDAGYTKCGITKNPKKIYDFYLSKTFDDKTVVFVSQSGLKLYMKHKYNIDLFRCPDEAYIIEYKNGKKVLKVLEKKEQNVDGSVETKLWSGPSLKREYELVLGPDFEVHYGFCVSEYLQKKMLSAEKKYTVLNKILGEQNIAVLFGDNANYFETLDDWITTTSSSV